MLNWSTIGYGLTLALNDIIMMPFVKHIVGGWPIYLMFIPMLFYALDPVIFYFALQTQGMAITNLVWNSLSNMIITLIGVFYFQEVLSGYKLIGIVLSFIGVICMTYEPKN